jgi:chromosome segregation ATPase
MRAERDAGSADAGSRAEVRAMAMELELHALRTRVAELQDELQRARDEAGQLDETNDHLSAMRQQLTDTDERQRQRDEQIDAQHAAAQQAVLQIGAVQESLAYGDSNVDSSLSHIEVGLTGVARSDVSAARAALNRGDSFAARIWLSQATADAQRSRY